MPSPTPRLAEAALDAAEIGAFEWHATTSETHWDGSWRKVLGLEPTTAPPPLEELLKWIDPADRAKAPLVADAMRAGLRFDTTLLLRCPDGQHRWIRLRGQPRKTSADTLVMVGAIEDVTIRTREQLRLQQRDDEYHVLTDYALDMILRTDVERRVLYISKSCERVLGFTPAELVGSQARDAIHPEDRERADASYDEIIAGPGYSTAIFRVSHTDGHWVWIESLGHVIRDAATGEPREVLYIIRDCSRRIEAENQKRRANAELLHALRDKAESQRSEALFRGLADSTPVLMWLTDTEGRPTWGNRALFDFTGHKRGERPPGSPPLHPDDVDRTLHDFRTALEQRASCSVEARIERHDGEYRNTLFTALPRQDADGAFAGYVASGVDVTDIRRVEQANAEHQSHLAHSLRVESLDQMALGLAHELHQPLAAISAATGAALRSLGTTTPDLRRIREMMGETRTQAIRAGELLEEMREFIRKGNAHHSTTQQDAIDLNEIVESVAKLTHHEGKRREIQLEMVLAPGPLLVNASRVQIQQVLINVVQNGLEAMSPGNGSARILRIETGKTSRGTSQVRILDRGPGISEEGARHMFDVFYTTRTDGLGMGLAISRSIVEAHGGRLDGANRPEGGACFSVTLPLAARDASQPDGPESAGR